MHCVLSSRESKSHSTCKRSLLLLAIFFCFSFSTPSKVLVIKKFMFLGTNVSWALVRSRFKLCFPSSLRKAYRRTKCNRKFTATSCLLAGLQRKIYPHEAGTSTSCEKSGQSWLKGIIVGHPIGCTEDSWIWIGQFFIPPLSFKSRGRCEVWFFLYHLITRS